MHPRSLGAFVALVAAVVLLAWSGVAAAQEDSRLLRFPHIHGNTVVFTYAGDLYTAPISGGEARRLTSHEGLEMFARFSPDGRWIAFSGEYAGTRQVYVMPASGGTPRQLTFYPDVGPMAPRGGYDHLVLDWTPDGSKILMRAARTPWGERVGRYYLVDPVNGGLEVALEIPEGATGATYDPTGTKLAFNIKSREWRHWKRYRAGRAQNVWIYDLANHTSQQVTAQSSTDNFPMWIEDEVYFVSDRDENEKLNLWVYDTRSGAATQVTRFTEFDVMWPSRGEGGIVFENGGYLYHLNPSTKQSRKLSITVTGDRPHTTPYFKNVAPNVETFAISPSGNRAVFAARGEIFSAPAKDGNIRNLSRTPAHRERGVVWSPDGKWISYFSDASGDYDLYVMPADGSGEPRRLVTGEEVWMDGVQWSPDSRWIAWSDNINRLRAMEVESRRLVDIDQTGMGALNDFSWSADSRWIAYAKNDDNTMSSIWLYSFDTDRTARVTDDVTSESRPAFDPKARFLYFVSARDFSYSGGQGSFQSRVFVATLRADHGHPFPPKSDEEPALAAGASGSRGGGSGASTAGQAGSAQAGGSGPSQAAGSGAAAVEPVRVDLEGLGQRVMPLPGLNPGTYQGLIPVDDGLLYFSGGSLHKYTLDSRESAEIIARVSGVSVSPDRKKLLYRAGQSDYGIVEVRPGQRNDAGRLDLDGMELRIDPRVEWAQIYHDAWLIMRDWFYDPGMHGVDWEAMRDRYQPLVEHVAHRVDLDYIITELIAELNVGHAYLNATSELPRPGRVDVALLGAELEADGPRYRIARIFRGENWHEPYRSPLTEPGIGVNVGDYLIAIDGDEVTTADNPYAFLVGKAERTIEVTVNDRPRMEGARSYTVRPVTSELGLRYQEWVRRNAALVDSLSGGRIGYIHLPDTGVPGHRELYEGWRPLHLKEALILDDRYNGGGFIPEQMALMVGAPLLNFWARRHLDLYSQPAVVHTGPKALLINGQASSGGDAFPYYFRHLDLGPIIGERTWGGLVGISGNPSFVDGGSLSVPRFAFVDVEGDWAVEAEGVAPDPGFEMVDRPEDIAFGHERMIERAVEHLLQELEKPQYQRPGKPAGPIRAPGGGGE
jgi:tricorn protease